MAARVSTGRRALKSAALYSTVMLYVRAEHPDPLRPLPQMRMVYRSAPRNPACGLYLKRYALSSVKVPWPGGDTTAAEVYTTLERLEIAIEQVLPPVDTPVVDTESF
jgi:hypothetical protein